jgi:hypothetical protein
MKNEFDLECTENAENDLKELTTDKSKKIAAKAVVNTLPPPTPFNCRFYAYLRAVF